MSFREVDDDDDWEAEGGDEANSIYERCKSSTHACVTGCRDDIGKIRYLINVCIDALLSSENRGQPKSQSDAAHTLFFFLLPMLDGLDEEMKKL